jgi:hypothetical protein
MASIATLALNFASYFFLVCFICTKLLTFNLGILYSKRLFFRYKQGAKKSWHPKERQD